MSKSKPEPDFELEDDEMVPVVDTKKAPKKKVVAKKARKQEGPTRVVATRLPTPHALKLESMNVDVAKLFKEFVEKEVLKGNTCPCCGQELKKG